MSSAFFTLACPVCRTTIEIPFAAPWRCIVDAKHEPLRIRGPFIGSPR